MYKYARVEKNLLYTGSGLLPKIDKKKYFILALLTKLSAYVYKLFWENKLELLRLYSKKTTPGSRNHRAFMTKELESFLSCNGH